MDDPSVSALGQGHAPLKVEAAPAQESAGLAHLLASRLHRQLDAPTMSTIRHTTSSRRGPGHLCRGCRFPASPGHSGLREHLDLAVGVESLTQTAAAASCRRP